MFDPNNPLIRSWFVNSKPGKPNFSGHHIWKQIMCHFKGSWAKIGLKPSMKKTIHFTYLHDLNSLFLIKLKSYYSTIHIWYIFRVLKTAMLLFWPGSAVIHDARWYDSSTLPHPLLVLPFLYAVCDTPRINWPSHKYSTVKHPSAADQQNSKNSHLVKTHRAFCPSGTEYKSGPCNFSAVT